MWSLTCGCGQITNTPIEFPINENSTKINSCNVSLPNTTDRTNCLIEKVILDYLNIINKLECGILPDLENLLEELSIIDMKHNGNFGVAKKVYVSEVGIDEDEDYLRKSKYLSEFISEEEKDKAIKNLGLDGIKHIILSRLEFDSLHGNYEKDTIYFVTE